MRTGLIRFVFIVTAMATASGCTFDRSGMADKFECIDSDDCPAGESCIDGRCRTAFDSGGRDAFDDTQLPDAPTQDADPFDTDPIDDMSTDGGPNPACPGQENTCGGCEELLSEPGSPCGGECGEGIWVCASHDTVICDSSDPDLNACGGCDPIEDVPGSTCGDCGEIRCTADGESTICDDAGFNDCGGCGALSGDPGTNCGACSDGTWQCNDQNTAVTCVGATPLNACGGCGGLDAAPNSPCGPCGGGTWRCTNDGSSLVCENAGEANLCGGCGALEGAPDTACGPCLDGLWTCSSDDSSVSCEGASSLNACGGCGTLAGVPTASCGDCLDGLWVCSEDNSTVTCEGAREVNSCGGCETLSTEPGTICGTCELDEFICIDDETTDCDGDTRVNECDGCDELDDPPDTVCGPCDLDRFVCDVGNESTTCSGKTFGNSCEGCGDLDGEPGVTCSCDGLGDAIWLCETNESVICGDQNDSAAYADDLGSGNESATFEWAAWSDSASDRDWAMAAVNEDRSDRRIRLTAILTRTDDDFTSTSTPVSYRLCTFYRYNDDRGANVGSYSCGYSDDAATYDASQSCITPNCPDSEPFDASVDLLGCCDSDYYGYTDGDGRFFRGWVTEMTNIDQNTGGNPDDRGQAFVFATTTNSISPSPTVCDQYDAEIRF